MSLCLRSILSPSYLPIKIVYEFLTIPPEQHA
jgi:hypothetical protein